MALGPPASPLSPRGPIGLEGGHGGGDVVGQEMELGPAALLGRMDGEFGRWQREDQPGVAGVDRPGPEHLGQGGPGRVGIVAVGDGAGTVDRGGILSMAGTGARNVEAVDGLIQ